MNATEAQSTSRRVQPDTTAGTYATLLQERRGFGRIWAASLISLAGSWSSSVVLVGLVLQLTRSAFYASAVLVATTLPAFLLVPVVGRAADRLDRKRMIALANVAAAFVALGMIWVRSSHTVWIGVACTAAIAAANAFSAPASQAALPNLVSPPQLARANVLMSSSWAITMAVGSALGGAASAAFGRNAVFVANSVSFLVAASLIASVRTPFSDDPEASEREASGGSGGGSRSPALPGWRGLGSQLAGTRDDRRIVILLLAKVGFGISAGAIVLLSVLGAEVFRGGDAAIGVLFAARGIGATLGPFWGRAAVGDADRRLVSVIGLAMVVFGAAYLLVAGAPTLWMAVPLVALAHVGGSVQWTMSSYGLQRLTPDHMRGRISALDLGLVSLVMTVTLPAAGQLAQVMNPRVVVALLGALEMGYAAVWLRQSRKSWRTGATSYG